MSASHAERLPVLAHVLRAVGVLIVIAGVVDPAFTQARTGRPTVAVVSDDSVANAVLLSQVRGILSRTVTVTGAVHAQDAVRVIVGSAVPRGTTAGDSATDSATDAAVNRTTVPTFVVAPHAVRVVALDVPSRVSLASRVPFVAQLSTSGAATSGPATRAIVQLRQQGVVLSEDSVVLEPRRPSTVALSWTPARTGVQALEVHVVDRASGDSSSVLRAVVVDSARWRVVSYDARPSYLSTFVRRAIERDVRFAVSSRVVTASTAQQRVTLGQSRAPETLALLDAANADVILVGAPEALSTRDVDVLRSAMRESGVSVVLLADHAAAGPVDALVASGGWRTSVRREPARVRAALAPIVPADSVLLRALVVGSPARLPSDAEPLLVLDDASSQPVVWRVPVGRGELIVSGAFDAWRYRDAAQSTFDATWRDLVAASAARRAPRVSAEPDHLELAPGERTTLLVRTVGASVAPIVTLDADRGDGARLAVHATATAGEWLASVRAPSAVGAARLAVRGGNDVLSAPLVVPLIVAAQPQRGVADPTDVLASWARAHGGAIIPPTELASLPSRIAEASRAQPQQLPWHPMRSAWWIVPLTLALAGDWWLRRRRGWA